MLELLLREQDVELLFSLDGSRPCLGEELLQGVASVVDVGEL